jgi:hypothetical protein
VSIIEVSGLSKKYHIGTRVPYKTFMKALCCNSASFRETLMNVITSPAKLLKRNGLKRPLLGTDRRMRRFQCSDNRLEKKIM